MWLVSFESPRAGKMETTKALSQPDLDPPLALMSNLPNFAELQMLHLKETHQKELYLRVVARMTLGTTQEPSRVGTGQANILGIPLFQTHRQRKAACPRPSNPHIRSPEPPGVVRNLKTQPVPDPCSATVPLKTPECPPRETQQCHPYPTRDPVWGELCGAQFTMQRRGQGQKLYPTDPE